MFAISSHILTFIQHFQCQGESFIALEVKSNKKCLDLYAAMSFKCHLYAFKLQAKIVLSPGVCADP